MWRAFSRAALLAAALAMWMASASQASAQDIWSKPVVLDAKDEPFDQVFLHLTSTVQGRIEVTPAAMEMVKGRRITMRMDAVPLRTVIESIARTCSAPGKRLAARFDGAKCIIDVEVVKPPMPAGERPAESGPGGKLVSYQAKDASVLKALTTVLDSVSVPYRIQPDLRNIMERRRATVTVRSVSLRDAIGVLLQELLPGTQVVSWFDSESKAYVFLTYPMPPAHTTATVHAIEVTDKPVAPVISDLLRTSGGSYAFPTQLPASPRVTVPLPASSLRDAVKQVVAVAGLADKLVANENEGVVWIGRFPPDSSAANPEPAVTARFKDVDVRYALKAVFGAAGANYALDQGVGGVVTVDFVNLPLSQAVARVLAAARSPLSYSVRKENRVFHVVPNRDFDQWK